MIKTATRHHSFSLWVYPCLSTCPVLFSPNKHFNCFSTFCIYGNSFLQSQGARALSLTTGLVIRNWLSPYSNLTSVSDKELKTCFKPLQVGATKVRTRPSTSSTITFPLCLCHASAWIWSVPKHGSPGLLPFAYASDSTSSTCSKTIHLTVPLSS